MSLTSYSAQIVLQNLLQATMGTPTWPTAWYLGVSSTLPTFAKGSGTPWNFTEPVDSAYARQPVTFAAGPTLAYAWAEAPNAQVTFPTAAVNWAEVSWLGVFDAVQNGNLWAWFPLVRTTTDGATTAGSTTVTSATMNFTSSDVGQAVIAAGILPGTTIVSVTSRLPLPNAPTVTPEGTTGSTSYSYEVNVSNAIGSTPPSPPGSTTTGNATLSGTNYNLVSWDAVPLPAGSPGNLVYDSNLTNAIAAVGPTWIAFGESVGTANGNLNAASGYFIYYGTGAPVGTYAYFQSQPINVTPGSTYTLSVYLDNTNATSGDLDCFLNSVGPIQSGTQYLALSQPAGAAGLVSGSVTIPAGVNQVTVIWYVGNLAVPAGQQVTGYQPQLTETSTAQPYAPGPLFTYNVYREVAGSYESIGTTTALALEDIGQAASGTPPTSNTTGAAVMTSEATATATGLALAVGTPVTIETAEVLTLPVGGPVVTLQ